MSDQMYILFAWKGKQCPEVGILIEQSSAGPEETWHLKGC